MDKILFNDRLTVKTIKDGKITEYNCDFYQNYIDAEIRLRNSEEWKHTGTGARFIGDERPTRDDKNTIAYFNSLSFGKNENEVIYSVTIDGLSGIMRKDLNADKDSESHIIHSRKLSFNGSDLNADDTSFVTCVSENYYNSHIALFNINNNDYATITYGDCYDFDASYSMQNDNHILFATKGVGRNADGEFVCYSPSSIMEYDVLSGDINELISGKDSYCKPKDDENGNLFYIKRPETSERKTSVWKILLDIILIPWRILEAVYRYLEYFTLIYTGKKFVKNSSNPAKPQDKTEKEILIEGNLINAENEYKNNLRHKDAFAGFAPRSWELIKRSSDGTESTLAKGVIDYCFTSDGELIYTNGKHVLLINRDGKTQKLADTSLCTKVACHAE